jgi:hypothetical protein
MHGLTSQFGLFDQTRYVDERHFEFDIAQRINLKCEGFWMCSHLSLAKARDLSGKNNHGTMTGMSGHPWVAGPRGGKALDVAGTGDYVSVASAANLNITGNLTLSIWVKRNGTMDNYAACFNKRYSAGDPYNQYVIGTNALTNKPEFGVSTGGVGSQTVATSATALSDGVWTHLAGVYDGANVTLYTNGVQVAQTAKTGTVNTSSNALRIGDPEGTGVNAWKGGLHCARLWSRALSKSEIMTLYKIPYIGLSFKGDIVPYSEQIEAGGATVGTGLTDSILLSRMRLVA